MRLNDVLDLRAMDTVLNERTYFTVTDDENGRPNSKADADVIWVGPGII